MWLDQSNQSVMKFIVALFLVMFFITAYAAPSNCNSETSGNALSFDGSFEDSYDEDSDEYDSAVPADEAFMFKETTTFEPSAVHPSPFPVSQRDGNIVKKKESDVDITKQAAAGLHVLKLGKIQFVELSEKMMEQCLTKYFFCAIDCPIDFSMSCPKVADAKIYSTFVTKEQHANICVKPRAAELKLKSKSMSKKELAESKKQCVLRPCSCKAYEAEFIKMYGQDEFSKAIKTLQGMCQSWCTTGVKPKGVITEKEAMNAIDKMAEKILAGFKWLGNGFIFIGENIKKGFLIAGDGIKKGAQIVGNNVKKGAQIVGRGFNTGARFIGRGFTRGFGQMRNVGRRIGNGFRSFGRRIGGGFRSVGRRIGRFFRRFRW
jgi:hypothetical protein